MLSAWRRCVYLVAMPDPANGGSSYCDMAENIAEGYGGGMCTELDNPRACVQQWVEDQWFYAAVFIGGLFAFEGLCAIMAWKYVDEMEDDIHERVTREIVVASNQLSGSDQDDDFANPVISNFAAVRVGALN